jgi:hypothetical protein
MDIVGIILVIIVIIATIVIIGTVAGALIVHKGMNGFKKIWEEEPNE